MHRDGTPENGVLWLSMTALRIGLMWDSPENERWNARTLTSMARAGMLRLVGTRRSDDQTLELGVVLLRHDLETDAAWADFESMRAETAADSAANLGRVLKFAEGEGICYALQEAYSVYDPEHITADLVAHHVCGGCAACLPPGLAPTLPLPIPSTQGWDTPADSFTTLVGEPGVALCLEQQDSLWPRRLARLIEAASSAGVRQLIATSPVLGQAEVQRAIRTTVAVHGSKAPFVTRLPDTGWEHVNYLSRVPSLLLVDPVVNHLGGESIMERLPRPSLAVLPATMPTALRPEMTLAELFPAALTCDEAERKLRP
jgi:hypothetical protein